MKRLLLCLALISSFVPLSCGSLAAEPLRIFIRSGPKSHGPGAHDYPAVSQGLGAACSMSEARRQRAAMISPPRRSSTQTDVLILHAQEAGTSRSVRSARTCCEFLKRGGGLVVHPCGLRGWRSRDQRLVQDASSAVRGARPDTKWLEAPMYLYFTDRENPITQGHLELRHRRRDLLRHGHPAGGQDPCRRLHAEGRDTGGKGTRRPQQRAAEAVAKGEGR